MAREFFKAIVEEARRRHLLSEEHFSVDGTLLEAWASMKSFRPKDGGENPPADGGRNPAVDFRGERRTNDTHARGTQAALLRRGTEPALGGGDPGRVQSGVHGEADPGPRLT